MFHRIWMLIPMLLLLIACDDDPTTEAVLEHPLGGSYALEQLQVAVEAHTVRDTVLHLTTAVNDDSLLVLPAGTLVLSQTLVYEHVDSASVGGTVTLNHDGSAILNGRLPVNFGTGCAPFIQISDLTSDGFWEADTNTGTFSIDLLTDALDIDGIFHFASEELTVTYDVVDPLDERTLYTLEYLGLEYGLGGACVPVETITTRTMILERSTTSP